MLKHPNLPQFSPSKNFPHPPPWFPLRESSQGRALPEKAFSGLAPHPKGAPFQASPHGGNRRSAASGGKSEAVSRQCPEWRPQSGRQSAGTTVGRLSRSSMTERGFSAHFLQNPLPHCNLVRASGGGISCCAARNTRKKHTRNQGFWTSFFKCAYRLCMDFTFAACAATPVASLRSYRPKCSIVPVADPRSLTNNI